MSVRLSDRGEGKLQVLNDMRDLASYTVNACQNEKLFPKRSRWVFANRIVGECLDAVGNVSKANTMRLDREQFEIRKQYQMQAIASLEAMLVLIDLAYSAYHIDSRKIEYWTSKTTTALARIRGWMRSDAERLGR